MTLWTIQSIEFSRPEYWSGYPFPSPGKLPNPGIKPRSPALRADSLPAEPQEKPKNIGVGSLSLLQRIFPTQGSNPGLPHCRQILYHLSHQGRPESESESCSVVSYSLQPRGLYSPWNSPGLNTGVGSLSLLQGIFPTQGSNPRLLHWQGGFFTTEPPGKPPSPVTTPREGKLCLPSGC